MQFINLLPIKVRIHGFCVLLEFLGNAFFKSRFHVLVTEVPFKILSFWNSKTNFNHILWLNPPPSGTNLHTAWGSSTIPASVDRNVSAAQVDSWKSGTELYFYCRKVRRQFRSPRTKLASETHPWTLVRCKEQTFVDQIKCSFEKYHWKNSKQHRRRRPQIYRSIGLLSLLRFATRIFRCTTYGSFLSSPFPNILFKMSMTSACYFSPSWLVKQLTIYSTDLRKNKRSLARLNELNN